MGVKILGMNIEVHNINSDLNDRTKNIHEKISTIVKPLFIAIKKKPDYISKFLENETNNMSL